MAQRPGARRRPYLGRSHPLAKVAQHHCDEAHGHPSTALVGGVACGRCWEQAIRDDERVVVECDLPRDIEPDPTYVDDIAVSLACRGDRVALTRPEFREAVRRLAVRRLTPTAIAERLHANTYAVADALRRTAARQAVAA